MDSWWSSRPKFHDFFYRYQHRFQGYFGFVQLGIGRKYTFDFDFSQSQIYISRYWKQDSRFHYLWCKYQHRYHFDFWLVLLDRKVRHRPQQNFLQNQFYKHIFHFFFLSFLCIWEHSWCHIFHSSQCTHTLDFATFQRAMNIWEYRLGVLHRISGLRGR